jgi:ABC-type sugar transport system substrate-binding protein
VNPSLRRLLSFGAVLAIAASACSSSGSPPASTVASAGAPASATASEAASLGASGAVTGTPKNGTQFVVGWTPLSDPIDESRVAFDNGIKEGIEAAGGKYLYCSPSKAAGATGDPTAQANCVDNFIAQNVDAIVVYPIDNAALASAVKKANDADIPVFDFTSPIPSGAGAKVILTIQNGDREAGQAGGQKIVDELTKKYGSPKGTVLEVQGLLTTYAAQNRGGGFHDIVDKYPDIKVTSKPADWDTGKATPVIQDWFTANPDTDAIFMHSDGAYTPASKSVLEPMGKWLKVGDPKHVIIAGQDGSNLALYSVKCGYVDLVSDFGFVKLSKYLSDQVMLYLKSGATVKDGDVIQTGDPLYPTATVKVLPEYEGPIMFLGTVEVTPENADNPAFFGNAVQQPPNGTTAC